MFCGVGKAADCDALSIRGAFGANVAQFDAAIGSVLATLEVLRAEGTLAACGGGWGRAGRWRKCLGWH